MEGRGGTVGGMGGGGGRPGGHYTGSVLRPVYSDTTQLDFELS